MFLNPPTERRFLDELQAWQKEETGYQRWIQGTRPQTLAFALADSPVGLAAWFAEKYRAWTDCGGDPRNALSMDEMLGNIGLYWFTGCIGASFWPYYARLHGPWPIGGAVSVPTGYAEFPREIHRPPRNRRSGCSEHPALGVMPRGGTSPRSSSQGAAEITAFFDGLG